MRRFETENRQTVTAGRRAKTVTDCTSQYATEGPERTCPRPSVDGHDECVFHLTPAEREATRVDTRALREAFLADVNAEDPARREYVGFHVRDLDLSTLVVDGRDVGPVTFRDVTVDGALDFTGDVLAHPLVVENSRWLNNLSVDTPKTVTSSSMSTQARSCSEHMWSVQTE